MKLTLKPTSAGIKVLSNDKMPQQMCIMCLDKINDFYEFRLMAENTEKQTREALGLPIPVVLATGPAPPPRIIIRQKIVETKPLTVHLVDLKYSVEDQILIDRALGRPKVKTENIPSTSTSKKRTEKAVTAAQPPLKKSKKELSCSICADSQFSYQSDLNE